MCSYKNKNNRITLKLVICIILACFITSVNAKEVHNEKHRTVRHSEFYSKKHKSSTKKEFHHKLNRSKNMSVSHSHNKRFNGNVAKRSPKARGSRIQRHVESNPERKFFVTHNV